MSTGATMQVDIVNDRQDDTTAASQVNSTAIDLTHDLQGMGFVTPATSDLTTVPAQGHIRRVVVADFTADFMAMYPTDLERSRILLNFLRSVIESRGILVADTSSVVLF